MRITGGMFRSRTLKTSGFQGTRPTTDRARETIFNIVLNHTDFAGATVLDVCAGTGALGIEALSRALEMCDEAGDEIHDTIHGVFIEKSRMNARLLGEQLHALDLNRCTQVLAMDALRGIQHLSTLDTRYTLVFCDPPYAAKLINPVFAALHTSEICAQNCILVAEHDTRETVLVPQGWKRLAERQFGETIVEFFQQH